MPIPIFQVDAFTSEPFRGNPAAVCLLDKERDDAWMQSLAMEMNLSETAFLLPKGENEFSLRWMTPEVEVDLCGHATLASAHILFDLGMANASLPIRFHTRSGILTAGQRDGMIELDFPALETSIDTEHTQAFADALGVDAFVFVGRGPYDYLLELTTEIDVRNLTPDFDLLRKFEMRGLIVTARADTVTSYDFVSRGFFPGVGIDEDPVTGSAHCALGPYWANKLGRTELVGYQASKRGGTVKVCVDGERVRLLGNAVTVFRGELTSP